MRRRLGWAPYSVVSAAPRNRLLNQPVIVPWQAPPQVNDLRGRLSARATRRENRLSLVTVSTPYSGWWKLMIHLGLMSLRNRMTARVSGSDAGRGPDS